MSHDSNRTRIWFPLFSYFESSATFGVVPNEYDNLKGIFRTLGNWLVSIKDLCMLTARRIWVNQKDNISKIRLNPESAKRQKRSQSHTPGRGSKQVGFSNDGGETEGSRKNLRKSTGNLSIDDKIDKSGSSTKKSKIHGPTAKKVN